MTSVTNPTILFNAIPKDWPVVGEHLVCDTSTTIDLERIPLNGGVLLKTLLLSPDPYMRGRMRYPTVKSYVSPFKVGEAVDNHGVAIVLRSETEKFKKDDYVVGMLPWAAYNILPADFDLTIVENEHKIPWSYFIGILGMPGYTAYYGLNRIVGLKKGQKIFVSAASGAVGAAVVQLAKLKGAKVIASAGSDEKLAFLKDIGVDYAFNYKTADIDKELEEFGELDVYWDNVGGPTLDSALLHMKDGGMVALCGMISSYNDGGEHYGIRNLHAVLEKSLRVQGFIVGNLIAAEGGTEAFHAEMDDLVKDGKLKCKEYHTKGIENAPQALLDVLKGQNFGKSIVIVAEP